MDNKISKKGKLLDISIPIFSTAGLTASVIGAICLSLVTISFLLSILYPSSDFDLIFAFASIPTFPAGILGLIFSLIAKKLLNDLIPEKIISGGEFDEEKVTKYELFSKIGFIAGLVTIIAFIIGLIILFIYFLGFSPTRRIY